MLKNKFKVLKIRKLYCFIKIFVLSLSKRDGNKTMKVVLSMREKFHTQVILSGMLN